MYTVPLEMQTYNGFYNKALFAQAGITTLPTDWTEMMADAKLLKDKGIQPFVYGTGAQGLTAGFYPFYDLSYIMMMLPVADWQKLYTGALPWTDPTIKAQLDKWVSLYKNGYTNQDVLNDTESWQQFLQGKAAMTMEGTWAHLRGRAGHRFQRRRLHAAVHRSADQGRGGVPRRRVRDDQLLPEQGRGGRLPRLHGHAGRPEDHRRRRA